MTVVHRNFIPLTEENAFSFLVVVKKWAPGVWVIGFDIPYLKTSIHNIATYFILMLTLNIVEWGGAVMVEESKGSIENPFYLCVNLGMVALWRH